MKVFYDIEEFNSAKPTALSLGKFDGLHLGHMLLMDELIAAKSEGMSTAIFTFDIPPKSLTTGEGISQINTEAEKLSLLEALGVDMVLVCPFTQEVMRMAPEDFITKIATNINAKKIIVGSDFCFGYKKAGNTELLKRLSSKLGYELVVKDKLVIDSKEVSSSLIRELIIKGDLAKANKLLGYNYFVDGEVVHGNRIGHKIDVPTINVPISEIKTTPPFGVYATRLIIDGKKYEGIANIGVKPTVEAIGLGSNSVSLEMNIFDFEKELYSSKVRVEILDFVRPEKKFDDILCLQEQIKQDIISMRKIFVNKNETEM